MAKHTDARLFFVNIKFLGTCIECGVVNIDCGLVRIQIQYASICMLFQVGTCEFVCACVFFPFKPYGY